MTNFREGGVGQPIVSKNNRFRPCVDPHQLYEFHENRFKSVICIVTVVIIISQKPRSVIFECKLKNMFEVLMLESILIQKKI